MAGNPDSGKPRILPGQTFKRHFQRANERIVPLPRATRRGVIVPLPPATSRPRPAKPNKKMFRRDI